MSEVNKAIYRRAWQELMNQRNLAIVDELFAPNYVLHDPLRRHTGASEADLCTSTRGATLA